MEKRLLIIFFFFALVLNAFAQTEYFTEGFESANLTTTRPETPTVVTLDSGNWILYWVSKGTNTSYVSSGTADLRMVKPSTVTTGGFSYAITPDLPNGVETVKLSEGRGQPVTIEKSTDGGTTWELVGTITCSPIKTPTSIDVKDSKANKIRISNQTTGSGKDLDVDDVVITKYSGTDIEKQNGLPTTYSLEQNYPNPFNPTTKISFSIPQSGYTRLVVYNLLGKEVAQLVNRNLNAGNYSFAFDAHNLPSGLYLYSLNSGNYSVTKKMLLLK